jgi:putative aminopeptidase FrvX
VRKANNLPFGSGLVVRLWIKERFTAARFTKTVTETAEKTASLGRQKHDSRRNGRFAVQRSGIGVDTIAISVPLRNIHSPSSIAKISDFEEMPRLAKLVLDALAAE